MPEIPTQVEFNQAWEIVFGFPFEQCEVQSYFNDGQNMGFNVRTPEGTCSNGGFGYHTPTPNLKRKQSKYYSGCGCTWDTDADGNRFYLLDILTRKPVGNVKEIVATETVRNFFLQGKMNIENKTNSILT